MVGDEWVASQVVGNRVEKPVVRMEVDVIVLPQVSTGEFLIGVRCAATSDDHKPPGIWRDPD